MRKIVSGVMFALILISALAMAFSVKPVKAWTGTVYIRADGSIDPPDAPIVTYDKITYILTDNITSSGDGIVIERDNIIIDGAGYTLQGSGTGSGKGINLSGRTNVTVRNTQIKNFCYGVWLYYFSDHNVITGNNITANGCGIMLDYSSNYNVITGNNITENFSFYMAGVYIDHSSNNVISGNSITANSPDGIQLEHSSNNVITGNNIKGNRYGIRLYDSSNHNIISGNNITANKSNGIYLPYSDYNVMTGNNITDNGDGIWLYYSDHNVVSGNNIKGNKVGAKLTFSLYNEFYHNNFIYNREQVSYYFVMALHANAWDDGYPSGGNYWSDYTGVDYHSGPHQNETGSDGIGDTPYFIAEEEGDTDRYPLMAPLTAFDAGVWNGLEYFVDVISNSAVSNFIFDPSKGPFLKFNVTGDGGTIGFCRVTIPKSLLWAEDGWTITVGNQKITNYSETEDENNTYLYFTYCHSTKTVTIQGTHVIPETSSAPILPLFTMISIMAIILRKRIRQKTN